MIAEDDIKLMKSEVLLDTEDGGGRMTSNAVVDGLSNNLFPDISALDRTYGRVALRKAYAAVDTSNTDSYYGVQAIVAEAPADPRVSLALFSTKSWADRRTAARDRVEQYLARGPKWPGQLLEKQLAGQRAITLLLKAGDAQPATGQSMVLVQDEGKATEYEQFVRVTRVTATTREFVTTGSGSTTVRFTGIVCTVELSDPLRYDFSGLAPSYYDDITPQAVCRDTRVADAAKYFGIQPTTAAAKPGDLTVKVSDIFTQLVPSAQSESPLVDVLASSKTTPVVSSAIQGFNMQMTLSGALPWVRFLYLGVTPGSLSIAAPGGTVTDSAGQLLQNGSQVGTIDYATGKVQITSNVGGGTVGLSYLPAVAPARSAESASIEIGAENRGNVYTINLNPPPAPRSLSIAYMAQGRWYELTDQGGTGNTGEVRGADSAIGSGSVNYATGSVVLTTGALPDAGTDVLFFWSGRPNYMVRQPSSTQKPGIVFRIEQPGNTRYLDGSATITWPRAGSGNYIASINADGSISGDATGSMRWDGTGFEVKLYPNALPAKGAVFTVNYQLGEKRTKTFPAVVRDPQGNVSVTVDDRNILRNSIRLQWSIGIADFEAISRVPATMQTVSQVDTSVLARDTGGGALARQIGTGFTVLAGAVDYAAGSMTFAPDITVSVPQPEYNVSAIGFAGGSFGAGASLLYRNTFVGIGYHNAAGAYDGGAITVEYMVQATTQAANQQQLTVDSWSIDLTDHYGEKVVPGSVLFTWAGRTYYDQAGYLYTDFDPATGSGVQAGTINYSSGIAEVTVWTSGGANDTGIRSLLTEVTGQPVDYVVFRVPAAPVRPGSLQVRAAPVSGQPISVTADSTGLITSPVCVGVIDYQTGIVRIRFGRLVDAAGNENKIWYDQAAVVSGKIFEPLPVYADTIKYNAVAYTYLPLSADVLGLDPVRLPGDGRVPIYRKGDVVVVHHAAQKQFPASPGAGTVVDVGRVRLASLRVVDSAGTALDSAAYAADLDAGTVTLKSGFSVTGLQLPLFAVHRIEDMAVVSDVQINGTLQLTASLTHNFPAGETRVSSALVIGDLQARAYSLLSQQSWTNVWSDTLIGNPTTSQYNATQYPPVVTNRGALQERWALIFTSTTDFRIVGESVGQVGTGTVNADTAPPNPATGAPYFTIKAAGWGGGWSQGNVLRFNTAAANYPIWIARTVLQGPAQQINDSFRVQIRGDIDR